MNLFIFDVETTGLDPNKHGIVQIGGIIEIDGVTKETFSITSDIFYRDEISDTALDVNGFTRETISTFQEPRHAYKQLEEILARHIAFPYDFDPKHKYIPVGWNVSFDLAFLKAWMAKLWKPYDDWFDYHSIDVASIAMAERIYSGGHVCSQSELANKYHITYKEHDALEDAKVSQQLLHLYLGRFDLRISEWMT